MSEFGVFSGPHFPSFRLNTDIYSLNLRIHSKCESELGIRDLIKTYITRSPKGYKKQPLYAWNLSTCGSECAISV